MGSEVVVVVLEAAELSLKFSSCFEDFSVEKFISKFIIEAFDSSVLPG